MCTTTINNGSLISEDIAKFYRHSITDKSTDCDEYFQNNFSYDFEAMVKLILLPHQELSDLQYLSYHDFVNRYERLLPVFVHSKIVADELRCQPRTNINVEWLGKNSKHLDHLINSTEKLPTIEFILLTTALLEKSLGDIYLLKSGRVTRPHLLKDLLTTEELMDVFGFEAISFLRTLLGIPHSINLRNIVWHGFPRTNDIPAYYASVLLLLVHSLGCVLKTKGLDTYESQYFEYQSKIVQKKVFPVHKVKDSMKLVGKCSWLTQGYKEYWEKIYAYYEKNVSWLVMLVILPQIELLLRIKYSKANNVDVYAKLNDYYITMDTIFESTLPNNDDRENVLLKSSDFAGVLNCIYDYFIAPSGPRIRDKMSHGELILENINAMDTNVLLLISSSLLRENNDEDPLADYESQHHLSSMTKRYYEEACKELSKLSMKHSIDAVCLPKQLNEITWLHKTKIFNRPRREREFMSILYDILLLLVQTSQQYEDAIATRQNLLDNKQLHSKRRRTLENMLAILPNTINVMFNIIETCKWLILKLQNDDYFIYNSEELKKPLLRFLKSTLTICQKLSKYSAKHNNEWIKAVDVCDKFMQNQVIFFNSYDNAQK